jgi:hypothetical protein
MRQTSGNIWPTPLLDSDNNEMAVLDRTRDTRYFEMRTESMLRFFDKLGVKEGDINADMLGIFSRMNIGRDLKARTAHLTIPNHLFSNRKNGCVWTPKGKMRLKTQDIPTYAIEVNMEQCPDALWGDCFEMMFGEGNGVRDLLGTPEGRAMFAMFLRNVYLGIGNSFFNLTAFSNHPMIETANTLGFYSTYTDASDWTAFYDQMTSTELGGYVTLLDDLAAEGTPGYDVAISETDFDANGNYTGDIIAFLEGMKSKARGDFRAMIRAEKTPGTPRPIFLLSDKLFDAYSEHIKTTYTGISEGYRYRILGVDGQVITAENILQYGGLPVARWDASESFDAVTGATSHRAALIAPGLFGIAYSGDVANQYNGMGLKILQRLEAPYQGKLYLDTTLRVGAALADQDFCVYGSLLTYPA